VGGSFSSKLEVGSLRQSRRREQPLFRTGQITEHLRRMGVRILQPKPIRTSRSLSHRPRSKQRRPTIPRRRKNPRHNRSIRNPNRSTTRIQNQPTLTPHQTPLLHPPTISSTPLPNKPPTLPLRRVWISLFF
jgi:hypothetical protein